jgi:superfamily II DNA/RNA helicase
VPNSTVRRSAHSTTPRQNASTRNTRTQHDKPRRTWSDEPRQHGERRDNQRGDQRSDQRGDQRGSWSNDRRDAPRSDNRRRDNSANDDRRREGRFGDNRRDGRSFGDNPRGQRAFDGDRRGARGNRDDRGARSYGETRRESRPFGDNRRDGRSFDNDRRPFGEDRRPRRDNAARRDSEVRPARVERPERTDGPAWDGEIVDTPTRKRQSVTFAELGLPTPLLDALAAAGIDAPFPIQAASLPDALSGRDVLGRAQTGSGKTLAFGLALLTRLANGQSRPQRPRALVLVPTRELAMQVEEALRPLARSLNLWCRTVVGGMSFTRQADLLRRGVDLLIATPGRLSDHVRQGTCVLDDVRFTALDEADQMADMGFMPQVRAILDLVPQDGQRMLFSATLDKDVSQLVNRYLTDPVTHSVSPATAAVDTMDHHLLLVSRDDKQAVVTEMAARDGRTILFLRTKHHVDRLTKQLRSVGVRAGALHGGKPQGARNRVLSEFRDGSLPVLVATDVAARGIHVDGISLVVHVDPPADAKGYLHRAGRTARAGETGTVVTMVTHQERRTVFRMTEQAGVQPERTKVTPGDADLVRITGARIPSGDPVVDPEPVRRPPRSGAPRGRFGNRPGRPRPRRADR